MDLEGVVHRLPQAIGCKDFQHRSFDHVILKTAINQRSGHVRHRFHRVNIGGHAGNFLFHQIEVTQRLFELLTGVGMFDR